MKVEWKQLGEFAKCEKAKNKKREEICPYSITQRGLVPTEEFFKQTTRVTSKDTSSYYIVHKNWFVYSPSRIDVGSINFLQVEGPVIVSPIDVVFSIDETQCHPTYLLSYLLSYEGMKQILSYREGVEGMGRRTLPFMDMAKVRIPLPLLDTQQQIVNQLDTFTSLIASLESELDLRRKQFEHYRNYLYGNSLEDIKESAKKGFATITTLSAIGTFQRGRRFVRTDIRDIGIPCIHYGDMYTYYGTKAYCTPTYLEENFPKKLRYAETNDVVIVGAGENDIDIGIGVAWLGKKKAAVHDACYIYSHKENPIYISHYLRTDIYHQQIKKSVASGKICSIPADGIGKAIIPLPPLATQQSIVEKLDAFEQLVAKLEEEIALRKKQYEYYREKLLTFE